MWPLWFDGTKIGSVSKSNYWNKLIFGELIKIQENEKLLQLLLDGGDKKWVQSFRS